MRKLIFIVLGCCLMSCVEDKSAEKSDYAVIRGNTMGTTYSIVFEDVRDEAEQVKVGVDSVLVALNQEVSTYIPASVISRVNSDTAISLNLLNLCNQDTSLCQHFQENFTIAKSLYERTSAYLDPTVMPLVNYWGFGYKGRSKIEQVDSNEIMKMLELVDFTKIELAGFNLSRSRGDMQLDFSAVAKGYGVDLVGLYLESQGVSNYLIEIGGEMLGKGKNNTGDFWRVGINTPKEGAPANAYEVVVALENRALATSGNYRIFYENEAGARYAHIINPKTGFSEQSNLLSVSVFAPDCASADGFATGFMTMGLDAALAIADSDATIEAAFIFVNEKEELEVVYSAGLQEEILMDKTKTRK